jgi:hypothetical protein
MFAKICLPNRCLVLLWIRPAMSRYFAFRLHLVSVKETLAPSPSGLDAQLSRLADRVDGIDTTRLEHPAVLTL